MSQARRQEHLHDAPASWLLQNILNRNDKSEHITYSDDAIRIIINWTKAAKSIFHISKQCHPLTGLPILIGGRTLFHSKKAVVVALI